MGYRAIFFRGEVMNSNPVLTFDGKELEPYDAQPTVNGWHLYYLPGTPIPADPGAWPRQLAARGWRMVRCGVEPDKSVLVVCERMQI
jgi:hypothetical protein